MPKSFPYKTLNEKHPEYNCDWITKLQLLYVGGDVIDKKASMFLKADVSRNENDKSFKARCESAAYTNYFAKIVNDYNGELFEKSFSVLPAADASDKTTSGDNVKAGEPSEFYKEFARNADLKNHDLSHVFYNLSQKAMVSQRAYLAVDFKKPTKVGNLGEEEKSGNDRAYVCDIDTLSVIDWSYDEYDNFNFVVIKSEDVPRKSIAQGRNTKRIDFKVWEKDAQTGVVRYELYRWEGPRDNDPQDNDACILVDGESGTVSFPEIPILCYHLPNHLWIGGLIGNLAIQHYRRNSELNWSKKRNLFSQAYIKKGPEYDGPVGDTGMLRLNDTQSDGNRDVEAKRELRNKGIVVMGEKDELGFWEPEGKVYPIEQEALKDLVNEMHALVGRGENTVGQQRIAPESGLKAMVDNRDKELVLTSHANLIKDFAPKLYRLISEGRKENIMWRVVGMEAFSFPDQDKLFARIEQMGGIPSKTWRKDVLFELATGTAQNMAAETQDEVKKEIDEHVDSMDDEDMIPPTPNQVLAASTEDKKKDKKEAK